VITKFVYAFFFNQQSEYNVLVFLWTNWRDDFPSSEEVCNLRRVCNIPTLVIAYQTTRCHKLNTTIPYWYWFQRGPSWGQHKLILTKWTYRVDGVIKLLVFCWQLCKGLHNEIPFPVQMDRNIFNDHWNCLSLQLERHFGLLYKQSKWYKESRTEWYKVSDTEFLIQSNIHGVNTRNRSLQRYERHVVCWKLRNLFCLLSKLYRVSVDCNRRT